MAQVQKSDVVALGVIEEVHDYTRGDAGMAYVARIESYLYGGGSLGPRLKFGSVGWVGYARYGKGERVLLFLKRKSYDEQLAKEKSPRRRERLASRVRYYQRAYGDELLFTVGPNCYITKAKRPAHVRGVELIPFEDYYDIVDDEVAKRTGRYTGTTTLWHNARQKAHESGYKDGRRHGPERYWYPYGHLRDETFWEDGKRHGESRVWHKDGARGPTRYYEDGEDTTSPSWNRVFVGEARARLRESAAGKKGKSASPDRPDPDVLAALVRPGKVELPGERLELDVRLGTSAGHNNGAEYLSGDTFLVEVELCNARMNAWLGHRKRELAKVKILRQEGILHEDVAKAVGLDEREGKRPGTVKVGVPPRGWGAYLTLAVERLGDRGDPRTAPAAASTVDVGRLVHSEGGGEDSVEKLATSKWRLDTRDLEPGRYVVRAMFEIPEQEAARHGLWTGRLAHPAAFTLVPPATASRYVRGSSHLAKAIDAFNDHRYEACMPHAEGAARMCHHGNRSRAHFILASAHEKLGNLEDAIRVLEKEAWHVRHDTVSRSGALCRRRIEVLKRKLAEQKLRPTNRREGGRGPGAAKGENPKDN